MNVIAVDDEFFALNDLTEVLNECIPNADIKSFTSADAAIN